MPTGETSCPRLVSIAAAGPLIASPPTIGETAMTGAGALAIASRRPSTASTGAMLTMGLLGAIRTASAAAIALRDPGAARALPSKRTSRTVARVPPRTKYSWNASQPSSVRIMVPHGDEGGERARIHDAAKTAEEPGRAHTTTQDDDRADRDGVLDDPEATLSTTSQVARARAHLSPRRPARASRRRTGHRPG